ncbi:intraflagellar transport protein 81 homolog isoform X1 [Dendronephthya gigantea]|uniref:intraflagellar transport protein 81 homolog isoform X1 n=1 Tax=Dendronephthya gigantea TaxID=151771 RepID=UPI001069D46F|nr:intraflagellar transport protein 81 homolog isoform X1 [Dendronephthya gigantea]
MSEQLKYIVDNLNQKPYNKSYNLISFDSLNPLTLLQILNDVFAEINPQHKLDIREEDPESMVVRMLTFLRVLKYKPTIGADNPNAFRQGLVQGEKPVVYPILQWLFQNMDDLKKRAYLARYLVRIDIPPDQIADQDISELNEGYGELMEQFKEFHKELERLKSSGYSTGEIKKDIVNMEDEREQLIKRVDRVKKKIESVKNHEKMITAARNLRIAREQETDLRQQMIDQKNQLLHAEQKYQRQQQQLKNTRSQGVGTTGSDLVRKLEEECKINSYLCQDKIPKDIEAKQKAIGDIQRVIDEPAMGQSDLDQLNQQIRQLSDEINKLIEKRMVRNDPIDDKLSLFRQQASIIVGKKDAAAEELREVMEELNAKEGDLQSKREALKQSEGSEVIKGDEFKRYVNKLRSKSTVYKKKRQELTELRAEYGVLSRSEEILKGREGQLNDHLSQLEVQKGVSGFHDTQEELEKVSSVKSGLDEQKGKSLDEISDMVRKLNSTIVEKKSSLAPIIKELRPMRQKCQEVTAEYDERKAIYENLAANLESNMSKLEQEVKALRDELAHDESRYFYLNSMTKLLKIQENRIEVEMKSYTSSDPNDKKKSYREQYTKKIQEQENLGKSLREKQKSVRENHGPSIKQMKMWNDLTTLLECKRECLKKASSQSKVPSSVQNGEDDVLIL